MQGVTRLNPHFTARQGAHSPLDCAAGLVLGGVILGWYLMFDMGTRLDQWMDTSHHVVEITWALVAASLYIYPRPDYWVSSFGDTYVVAHYPNTKHA